MDNETKSIGYIIKITESSKGEQVLRFGTVPKAIEEMRKRVKAIGVNGHLCFTFRCFEYNFFDGIDEEFKRRISKSIYEHFKGDQRIHVITYSGNNETNQILYTSLSRAFISISEEKDITKSYNFDIHIDQSLLDNINDTSNFRDGKYYKVYEPIERDPNNLLSYSEMAEMFKEGDNDIISYVIEKINDLNKMEIDLKKMMDVERSRMKQIRNGLHEYFSNDELEKMDSMINF